MYRRALCWAAIAVALPTLLLANSGHDPVQTGTVNSGMPPARYQSGNVRVMVTITDQADIEAACGKPQNGYIIACRKEYWAGGEEIFLPNPCPHGGAETYAKIVCHEAAHSKGWSGDHEL